MIYLDLFLVNYGTLELLTLKLPLYIVLIGHHVLLMCFLRLFLVVSVTVGEFLVLLRVLIQYAGQGII